VCFGQRSVRGIENHLEQLGDVGLDQEEADALRDVANRLESTDSEQEAAKAMVKVKTAELEAVKAEARRLRSKATKRIKVGLGDDQGLWVEFGITASR